MHIQVDEHPGTTAGRILFASVVGACDPSLTTCWTLSTIHVNFDLLHFVCVIHVGCTTSVDNVSNITYVCVVDVIFELVLLLAVRPLRSWPHQ